MGAAPLAFLGGKLPSSPRAPSRGCQRQERGYPACPLGDHLWAIPVYKHSSIQLVSCLLTGCVFRAMFSLFRDTFGLFQAIFNLSLSQQVWDNLRKNRRRPLKTLDQSGENKKKKGKSAKLFFLYLCLFTKMSFCIIPVKTMYISTVFNNQSRHSS